MKTSKKIKKQIIIDFEIEVPEKLDHLIDGATEAINSAVTDSVQKAKEIWESINEIKIKVDSSLKDLKDKKDDKL